MPEFKIINNKSYFLVTVIITLFAGIFLYHNFIAHSASYSFFQTDWSGGPSASTAAHPGNATDWDEFTSVNNVIATGTPGQVSLSTTTASWTKTETADFSTDSLSGTAATSGKIVLLKPAGVACASGVECMGGYCDGDGFCSTCESFIYSGQTYNTVIIGEQCWMAENLNVGSSTISTSTGVIHSDVSNNGIIEKYCYNNTPSMCETDGGLYDWNEMMGYVTTPGVQGICAPGWHIPTDAEWYELENGLATEDCSASRTGMECNPAGTLLKVDGSSNFNGFLGGWRANTGSYSFRNTYGNFWSSSESGGSAWRRFLYNAQSRIDRGTYDKVIGVSVRCLKN